MEMGFIDPNWHESGGAVVATPEGLRPLGWRELCARLAAVRDFRDAVAAEPGAGSPCCTTDRSGASFHRSAAMLLADPGHGGHIVNPMSSANGKGGGGKRRFAPVDASTGPDAPVPVE